MLAIKKKNERQYFGVLRNLAKSDTSIFNELKITVCEGEFIESKNHIFIAPSMFMSCHEFNNQNSNKISIENENPNEQTEISNENEIKNFDYPDSSDFSDDE